MSWKYPHFIAVVPRGLCHTPAARYSGPGDTIAVVHQTQREELRFLPNNISSEDCKLMWYLRINQSW